MTNDSEQTYRITPEMAVEAAQAMYLLRFRSQPAASILAGLILAIAGLMYLTFDGASFWIALLSMALGLVLLVSLSRQLMVPWLAKRQFRQSSAFDADVTVRLQDDGIGFTSRRGDTLMEWRDFYRYFETRNLILLFQTEAFYNIVPKAGLQGRSQELIDKLEAAGIRRF